MDATQVLLAKGCVQPAWLQLRALFEAHCCVAWIIADHSEDRARVYYTGHLLARRRRLLRLIPGTAEHSAFVSDLQHLSPPAQVRTDAQLQELTSGLAEVDRMLALPNYDRWRAAFARLQGKSPFEPDWYKVAPPESKRRSLRAIARELGRLGEYLIVYDPGSDRMHARSVDTQIRVSDNRLGLRSLRELQDMSLVASLTMANAIGLFGLFLDRFRPGERPVFAEHYKRHWRAPFMSRTEVNYVYDAVSLQ